MGGAPARDRAVKVPSRPKVRSVLLPAGHSRIVNQTFSDLAWERAKAPIPTRVDDHRDGAFKAAVQRSCDSYLSAVRLLAEGAATAAALRKPAGKQSSPLESLCRHLRAAAIAWSTVREMHDDRRGPLSDLGDRLEALANDAERRLAILSSMEPAMPPPSPQVFIRAIAKCCIEAGLKPTATGRVYEDEPPTWFQAFIAELNDAFLGGYGWGAPGTYSRNALFAEVARVLGDAK
ncbi:hypothetical protein Bra1253DRAFT_08445 [Bradyrhizobium sp. WSM1253]|nr:hypothetical protein Bra1253DRAFT_08445 [Bradyrhizobium sp. WSM1253]